MEYVILMKSELLPASLFTVYFSKVILLLALIRYNFESLTVIITFWKEIMRVGTKCLVAFRLFLPAIFWEPNIIRSSNNYSTNSTFMVALQQPP